MTVNKFKFIDLFSGIGGFRTGLEMHGHKCVAFCEIDKYARQSYKAMYDTTNEEELHDITQVTDEQWRKYRGSVDIITGGFPCQAFSIAGNRRGFDDTRGTLFFEIARAIKEIQPSYALLENVKGLFSHDKGRTFGTIIQALDELGYVVEWGLFNSKFWGVPQNRERVFILVTRKEVFKGPKLFDLLKEQTEVNTRLVDVLETSVDEKYFLSEKMTNKMILNNDLSGTLNKIQDSNRQPEISILGNTSNTGYNSHNVHHVEGISPTIAARDYKGAKQIAVPVLTPDSQDRQGEIINPLKDKTSNGWHFEQQVYDPKGITRAVKAGGGSGNIPKTILPKEEKVYSLEDLEERFMNESDPLKQGEIKQIIFDEFGVDRKCNRCTNQVLISDIKGYPYLCFECDENLFEFETYKDIEMVIGSTQKNTTITNGTLSPTLTSAMGEGGGHIPMAVYKELEIRKLTPLECWRLQGFTDDQFYKAKNAGVSNSQLYKQAGNSVTVNVIEAIAKTL